MWLAPTSPIQTQQELEHLNLALNSIQRVQNLQRCESLRRLDLTANFVDAAGLLSLRRWVLTTHLYSSTLQLCSRVKTTPPIIGC